jgi:hypothetical protein
MQMTPKDFIQKWSRSDCTERQAAQEHFIDLCRMIGEPTANEAADPESYTFEKGVSKVDGTGGFADVWKRGYFGWEYKKLGLDLRSEKTNGPRVYRIVLGVATRSAVPRIAPSRSLSAMPRVVIDLACRIECRSAKVDARGSAVALQGAQRHANACVVSARRRGPFQAGTCGCRIVILMRSGTSGDRCEDRGDLGTAKRTK